MLQLMKAPVVPLTHCATATSTTLTSKPSPAAAAAAVTVSVSTSTSSTQSTVLQSQSSTAPVKQTQPAGGDASAVLNKTFDRETAATSSLVLLYLTAGVTTGKQ